VPEQSWWELATKRALTNASRRAHGAASPSASVLFRFLEHTSRIGAEAFVGKSIKRGVNSCKCLFEIVGIEAGMLDGIYADVARMLFASPSPAVENSAARATTSEEKKRVDRGIEVS